MKNLICTVSVVLFLLLTLSAHPTLAAIINIPAEYATIQAGIDAAVDRDIVLVAPDTYVENIDFLGKAITLRSEAGPLVTILDGTQQGSVVSFTDLGTGEAVLDGFTITNGSGRYDVSVGRYHGGGIYCYASSPTITDCLITENFITGDGGGIYCDFLSSPTVSSCTITENLVEGSGGGIFWGDETSPTIVNCAISHNEAIYDGGGIACYQDSPSPILNCSILNCTITNNVAHNGGGIICNRTSPVIENCVFMGNIATWRGGGLFCYDGSRAAITNSTFSGNVGDEGGAIHGGRGGSSPVVTNCILWSDTGTTGNPEIYLRDGATVTVSFSDVQGGWSGNGNTDVDPLFSGEGDFHLEQGSPCIDAGDPDPAYNDACFPPSMGAERNDMGAYGGPGACRRRCDSDADGHEAEFCGGDDCDDVNPDTHPGAEEICDSRDNDCDGTIPEDEADADADEWMSCEGDCNDSNPEINPGTTEICDATDWDCSGDPFDRDADQDGYIDDNPVCMGDDCDDSDPLTYPSAPEICDGKDNDCDGTIPEDETDDDLDMYIECEPWVGENPDILGGGDCDDVDPEIYPGAQEFCDHIDNDCDELTDEDFDLDHDGFTTCDEPMADCDDADLEIYPGAPELCDGIDNDCDSIIDEEVDVDGDGSYDEACGGQDCDDEDPIIYPGAEELCDRKDSDCDGYVPWVEFMDLDGDGWVFCEDCNESDAGINPGVKESKGSQNCNDGMDNDCDGMIDTDLECYALLVPTFFPTIQSGIDYALDGDLILVDQGTYSGGIDFQGKSITLKSQYGPDVTIIEGVGGSVVTFSSGETEDTVLDGFTLTGGSGRYVEIYTGYEYAELRVGGGIYCAGASPTIINCIITDNYCFVYWSGPYFGELSAAFGGGIYCFNASPTIVNCMITHNTADSTPSLGGGICSFGVSVPTITHCTFAGNYCWMGSSSIYTIGNTKVVNCILWDDSPIMGPAWVRYSDVRGGWPGTGNIDADPLFVDPENGDYHLTAESPCIDTGATVLVAKDIDGQWRQLFAGFDMGADEYWP